MHVHRSKHRFITAKRMSWVENSLCKVRTFVGAESFLFANECTQRVRERPEKYPSRHSDSFF